MPADVLLDAIQSRTESRDTELRYRGYKMPNENVAVPRHGAQVITTLMIPQNQQLASSISR